MQQQEWAILLPLAFIVTYLLHTLHYTPTFPYFKHLPLYCNTTLFVEDGSQGVLLPLHKKRANSLPSHRSLFKPGFTVSPVSTCNGTADRDSSPYTPSRPSPLRSSFTETDIWDAGTCGLRRTVYMSPLTPQFSGDIHASATSAIAPQLQRQSPGTSATLSAAEEAFLDNDVPNAPPFNVVPPSARNACRPKKAKSFDNFRSTLFPLWEIEEADDSSSTMPSVVSDATSKTKAGRRLLGKRRACSNA